MRSPVFRLFLVLGMYALAAFAQEEKKAANLPIRQTNNPFPSSQSPARVAKCGELVKLRLPDLTITSATNTPAGRFTPPGSSNALETPAFCRVAAVARPTPDSVINFEVWIPSSEQWNRDFLGVGNGGYTGAISYGALANALQRGFATASTDTGHVGEDLEFAAGHPEKIVDWGYRSVHVMTESAKLIIRNYAGLFPQHSYFGGSMRRLRRLPGAAPGTSVPTPVASFLPRSCSFSF